MIECLAVQTFLDGVTDDKTQRTVRLTRSKILTDALAYDFKSAKIASRGHAKVRSVTEENDKT